jgi:Zn finger protein HypA/HybF involved in hydrogenase expression
MAAWRMAFRVGNKGHELWPDCQRAGLAGIAYEAFVDTDLSQYPEGEPMAAWSAHSPSQQASLKRFVYQMQKGDVIYVKQGPYIVGKGIVAGPYRYDKRSQIREPEGEYWQRLRHVHWVPGFPWVRLQLGQQQAVTVVRLTAEQVGRVEQAVAGCFADESDIECTKTEVNCLRNKRSRRLRDRAFEHARGICSVCRRDYSKVLGGRGVRVLQVHHRHQLSARTAPSITKLSELAVVCANCHLLLHLDSGMALGVEQLREMLQNDGTVDYA